MVVKRTRQVGLERAGQPAGFNHLADNQAVVQGIDPGRQRQAARLPQAPKAQHAKSCQGQNPAPSKEAFVSPAVNSEARQGERDAKQCPQQPRRKRQAHGVEKERAKRGHRDAHAQDAGQGFQRVFVAVPQPDPPAQPGQQKGSQSQCVQHFFTLSLSGQSSRSSLTVRLRTGCTKSGAISASGTSTKARSGSLGCGICSRRVFMTNWA